MGTRAQLTEKIESTVGWIVSDETDVRVIAVNPQNEVTLAVIWTSAAPEAGVSSVRIIEPDEFGNVAQFALGADVADKLQHAIDIVEKYDVLNYRTNRG